MTAPRFSGADRSTWHDDGKAKARSIARVKAAQERERRVLEMFVAGWRVPDIALQVDRSESQVYRIVERALERRAAMDPQTTEAARMIFEDRLLAILAAHMPLATGTYRQEVDGVLMPAGPPDVRSAELCAKIAERLFTVGSKAAGTPGTNAAPLDIHLHGAEADKAREVILDGLARLAKQQDIVEAELVDAGADYAELTAAVDTADKPALPGYDPGIAA